MARSLSNAIIRSALSDGVPVMISRRGYSATAAAMEEKKKVAAAVIRKKTEAETSWVPDPVTGYYRPADRRGEVDAAEQRRILLSHKISSSGRSNFNRSFDFDPDQMARSLSNAIIRSALSDGVPVLIRRRGYSATTAAMEEKKKVAAAVMGKKTEAETSWVPDPVTGYYRPANRRGEVDAAEMRRILLSRKVQNN
ncbi:Late embryogenesis abundant protein Lea5-D [Acorus calamus]|uniref:Late embryogenesis abundant protein Lea5-D n=1 Tax=Acorus calamus TaxID=4465 RepID=A0AAV9CU76_ACOCL|nr:Late embryogenesis abundant protein Lea5-D [Acorus calamus]